MSWFDKSLTNIKSFYTLVYPEIFYEWDYTGFVPKNTTIAYGAARSIKDLDRLVLSVDINSDQVVDDDGKTTLSSDLPITKTKFLSGSPKTRDEIAEGFDQLRKRFSNELDRFKESMQSRRYFVKDEKLCEIKQSDDSQAHLLNYGPWKEVLKKAEQTQINFKPDRIKTYKAIDLQDLHRLTHALIINQYDIPLDFDKLSALVKNCGTKPIGEFSSPWSDLFVSLNNNAHVMNVKLSQLDKLKWLKGKQNV